jgi:hypothetical protein
VPPINEMQIAGSALTKLQKDEIFLDRMMMVYAREGVQPTITFVERNLRIQGVSEAMAYVCAMSLILGISAMVQWANKEAKSG